MDRSLRSRYGVEPQVSTKDRVAWFDWPADEPIDADGIAEEVLNASLAVLEFHVLGEVSYAKGKAVFGGLELEFETEFKAGEYAVEIVGFADSTRELEIWSIQEIFEPKVYQES